MGGSEELAVNSDRLNNGADVSLADDFAEIVRVARETESTRSITNASISHAFILADELFQYAIDKRLDVRIVSGTLEVDFYDRLVGKAERILEAGNRIEIVVERFDDTNISNHAFYKLVKNHGKGLVVVSPITNTPHFILVGNKAFRLETSHKAKEAVASFNDNALGTILLFMFKNAVGATTQKPNDRPHGDDLTSPSAEKGRA